MHENIIRFSYKTTATKRCCPILLFTFSNYAGRFICWVIKIESYPKIPYCIGVNAFIFAIFYI